MALPASGSISVADINTELGRASGAVFDFATAATGGYVAINTDSPSYPNGSAPHSLSEWYSYNHTYSAAPTISGTPSMFTADFPGCGVNWTVGVTYSISNVNDTLYKLSVYNSSGSTLIADDVGQSAGSWGDYDTGQSGDPLLNDLTSSAQFTLKIIRRSDSNVMSAVQSDTIYQDHGFAC